MGNASTAVIRRKRSDKRKAGEYHDIMSQSGAFLCIFYAENGRFTDARVLGRETFLYGSSGWSAKS